MRFVLAPGQPIVFRVHGAFKRMREVVEYGMIKLAPGQLIYPLLCPRSAHLSGCAIALTNGDGSPLDMHRETRGGVGIGSEITSLMIVRQPITGKRFEALQGTSLSGRLNLLAKGKAILCQRGNRRAVGTMGHAQTA